MISSVELKINIMNKTELIDKLLHLGSTIEICNSTQTSKKAKELAHTLLDEYLKAINYTHCCEELCECAMPDPIDPFAEVDKDTCRKCNNLIA